MNHATGSGSAPLEACIPVIEQGDDIPVRFPGELGEPTCAIAFTNVGKCET